MIYLPKKQKLIYRRGFLTASLGLGLMPWLEPHRLAGAAPLPSRRRLIVFYTPGQPIGKNYWRPAMEKGATSIDLARATLPAPIDVLNGYKKDIFMVGGQLKLKSKDHEGTCALLTGRANVHPGGNPGGQSAARGAGISIDQLLGKRMGETPLVLGYGGRLNSLRGPSLMSSLGENRPVRPIISPTRAFEHLFGGPIGNETEAEAKRRVAQRRSLLDQNARQLMALRKNLAGGEKLNLDYHLEEIRRLENKLVDDERVAGRCSGTKPGLVKVEGEKTSRMKGARMQMDVMIEALRCGARNISIMQCGGGGQMMTQPCYAPEYDLDLTVNEHEMQHSEGKNMDKRIQIERAYYRLFAAFLDKMKAATDTDGLPLLDNSIVLWCKALGHRHSCDRMFYMLAGGKNSGITKLGTYEDPGNRYTNDLLISLLQLMGQSDEEFGDPQLTQGGIVV